MLKCEVVCIVHGILYIVYCSLHIYTIQRRVYNCTVYSLQCTTCTVNCTLYSVQYTVQVCKHSCSIEPMAGESGIHFLPPGAVLLSAEQCTLYSTLYTTVVQYTLQ